MTTTPHRDEWGWPERIACLYICTPVILFICTWFRPLLVLCCGIPYLYILLRDILIDRPSFQRSASGARTLGVCILFALLWVILSGINGFFYANHDWVIRFPLAHDLANFPWPVEYQSNAKTFILRSSLGFFLIPCAISKIAGTPQFLTNLMMVWSWLGVTLTIYMVFRDMKWQQALLAALIFSLGSGLDYIGTITFNPGNLHYGSHLEWWIRGLQYSSNTTQLFWVPNHTIAAWLATAMLFRNRNSDSILRKLIPVVPALMLWSPLSGGGFALLLAASTPRLFKPAVLRSLLPDALLCAPAALLLLAYIAEGATGISAQGHPQEYSWLVTTARATLFFLVEVGVFIAYIASKGEWKRLLPALIILAVLPYFHFGASNDLVMRASIPALAYLWFWLATSASDASVLFIKPWKAILFYVPFFIGTITPLHELERAVSAPSWNPDFSLNLPVSFLVDGSPEPFPSHYFAIINNSRLEPLLATPSKTEKVEVRIVYQAPPR